MAFDESVALRMIRGREPMIDAEERLELSPETAGKLPASVRDYGGRGSKACHPMAQQGQSAVLGSDGRQRDGFQPPRIPVNDGEEVTETLGLREGAHEVQMEGTEASIRHVQWRQRRSGVASDLGPLARDAGAAKILDAGGHGGPHITAADAPECGVAKCLGEYGP